jgi:hypothetical protein
MSHEGLGLAEVDIYDQGDNLITTPKTVTAQMDGFAMRPEDSSQNLSNLVDGNYDTNIKVLPYGRFWVQIDLSQSYNISKIVITTQKNNPDPMSIEPMMLMMSDIKVSNINSTGTQISSIPLVDMNNPSLDI